MPFGESSVTLAYPKVWCDDDADAAGSSSCAPPSCGLSQSSFKIRIWGTRAVNDHYCLFTPASNSAVLNLSRHKRLQPKPLASNLWFFPEWDTHHPKYSNPCRNYPQTKGTRPFFRKPPCSRSPFAVLFVYGQRGVGKVLWVSFIGLQGLPQP